MSLAAVPDPLWLPLRSNNPFLQIFGLPAFEPITARSIEQWQARVSLDVSNHADSNSVPDETATVDGETYRLTLSARYAHGDRLTLGIDVPYIWHSGGKLDAPIENWHDFWGLSNSDRSGPRDLLQFRYEGAGIESFDLESPVGSVGDIQLSGAIRLGNLDSAAGYHFGLRAGIELPTGNAGRLTGNGAIDAWLEANASVGCAFNDERFRFSTAGGILFPGRGDVLPQIQRHIVAFGSIAAGWQATERLVILAQFHAQSPYFDSGTDILGGYSTQLALGGQYTLSGRAVVLSFALVEDLFDNATTDVALHISANVNLGKSL